MSTARCEAMGARHMPGTASNIDVKIRNEAIRRGYDQMKSSTEAPLAAAAGYLVRQMATGRPLPEGVANVAELWRGYIEAEAGETLGDLEEKIADQAEFARFARQIITDLGYGDQLGDDPDQPDGDRERSPIPI